jgi:hypothetical protein
VLALATGGPWLGKGATIVFGNEGRVGSLRLQTGAALIERLFETGI